MLLPVNGVSAERGGTKGGGGKAGVEEGGGGVGRLRVEYDPTINL